MMMMMMENTPEDFLENYLRCSVRTPTKQMLVLSMLWLSGD